MKRKPAGHDRYELHPQLAADTHPVASFALSDLRLMDDSNYPWLVLVPRVAGASELVDLDPMQRRELGDEIDQASRLLRDAFVPFKLNVAALGNLVPQLHVHVIARFENDRSEEHTSELQSLMRISYAVFCLKKKKKRTIHQDTENDN